MSLASAMVDVVSGGGITTIFSGLIAAYAKYKERKLDIEYQRERWRYELEMYQAESTHETFLAEQELLIRREQGANDLMQAAIQAEARIDAYNLPIWVNSVRALFRPFLTLAIWTGIVILVFTDPQEDSTIMNMVTMTMTQGAAASLGFWFGSRLIKTEAEKR